MANGSLKLTLELEKNECIRGESVHFKVIIENVSNAAISDFAPPEPDNETIKLIATSKRERRKAGQLTPEKREGVHRHGRRVPGKTITLGPKQKLDITGDLLSWFGELEPADYEITAEHVYMLESLPVKLRVLAAKPASAITPRYTTQGPAPMMPAAWSHKQDKGELFFYQLHSPSLPRCVKHCYRAPDVTEESNPTAAIIANTDVRAGHLVWTKKEKNILFAPFDLETGAAGKKGEIKLTAPGELLASPLSMPGGVLWLPIARNERNELLILKATPDGKLEEFLLDLGAAKPLGTYLTFWEHGLRLQFVWSADGGREVMLAKLTLADPKSGFVSRSIYVADDPVVWLDAFFDTKAPVRDAPYFEEQMTPEQKAQPPVPLDPPLMIVCVTQTAVALHVFHINTTTGQHKRVALLPLTGIEKPRIISGVVTYESNLVVLLADEKGDLHVASMTSNRLQRLSDIVQDDVKLEHNPSLLAATRQGRSPWVHLRYFDSEAIRYVRIEPEEEQDPLEIKEQASASARRSRRR